MKTVAILDVETTGLDPTKDHLLEVAVGLYSVEHAALLECRSWLVAGAPAEAVKASQHIHGIAPAVAATGWDPHNITAELDGAFVDQADALVAHNAAFDRQWVCQGRDRWICTMDDVSWPRASSRSLTAVALAHGVGVVAAHRALDDVSTLARLLTRAAELLGGGDGLARMLARGLRPKALFEVADRGFSAERNALAKEAGFRWNGDRKAWERSMAVEDVDALPFRVREVA